MHNKFSIAKKILKILGMLHSTVIQVPKMYDIKKKKKKQGAKFVES